MTAADTKSKAPAAASLRTFTAAIFGRSKKGKTLAALRCFPDARVITASPGAAAVLRTAHPDVDLRVEEVVVANLRELRRAIKEVPHGGRVVLDDVSEIATRSVVQARAQGIDGYELWGSIQASFLSARETALEGDKQAIWTFHERPPEANKSTGDLDPGGPMLPSRSLTAMVPHLVGLVGRVVPASPMPSPPLWPNALYVYPQDSAWLTGDRYNATAQHTPLSLREVIVVARTLYPHLALPPRPKGLEWMDAAVDWLAAQWIAGAPDAEIPKLLVAATPRATPSVRAWIHQDAWTRVSVHRAADAKFAAYR